MQISYPTWKWLLIGGGLLLLLMMLFYPPGYDQMAFMIGGEMTVKHGAVTYRDFLDTKPPVIFLIYGIASVMFGHHEWSIRVFDILFQIGSLFYFFKILKRTTEDEKFALGTVFLYTLFYVTSGYWMTAQAETFALLPTLIAFDLTEKIRTRNSQEKRPEFLYGIYAGLSCAILFLLKFTLMTVPLGIVIYLLLKSNRGEFPKKYILGLTVGLIAIVGFYAVYLVMTGTMQRFMEALDWVTKYGGMYPIFSTYTISERFFKLFPIDILGAFSLSGSLISGIGIHRYFRTDYSPEKTDARFRQPVFIHFLIQFLLGLAAVLYEGKFFPYQFSRIYWSFVPFVALGLIELSKIWKERFRYWKTLLFKDRILRYSVAFIVAGALLFFSAATRLISQPLFWTWMTISGGDIPQHVQDEMPQYFYKEQIQLSERMKNIIKPEDTIFIWGNNVGIYFFLGKYPATMCLTNTPFVTAWTPEIWKTTLMEQLKTHPPRFFISEFGDQRIYITGNKMDSWQHVQNWPELKSFLESQYQFKEEFGHFKIFEKRSSLVSLL